MAMLHQVSETRPQTLLVVVPAAQSNPDRPSVVLPQANALLVRRHVTTYRPVPPTVDRVRPEGRTPRRGRAKEGAQMAGETSSLSAHFGSLGGRVGLSSSECCEEPRAEGNLTWRRGEREEKRAKRGRARNCPSSAPPGEIRQSGPAVVL